MKRLLPCLLLAACLGPACALENTPCGLSGGGSCGGSESVCVCETGRCAEPDDRCLSGLHYTGGRCVTEAAAATAVVSTPDDPGVCPVADGGVDDGRVDVDVSDVADGG